MSDYFNAQQNRITNGVTARAQDVNGLRDEVGAGFDLLPDLDPVLRVTIDYATVGGTGNVITLTLDNVPTSYVDGQPVTWKTSASNTGAVTVNLNSLGAKSLVTNSGNALVANDLTANTIYTARYNATGDRFELQQVVEATLNAKVTAAQTAQTAAETAETNAETAQTAAETAQSGAETAQTGAQTARTGAETAETNAETAESNAAASAVLAAAWANEDEDVVVASGEFSAFHWAQKAQNVGSTQFWSFRTTATSTTAVSLEHISVTAASQTITLPASPTNGDRVAVSVGNFTNTVIARNGNNILGQAEDRTINRAYASVEMVFANSNWEMYAYGP